MATRTFRWSLAWVAVMLSIGAGACRGQSGTAKRTRPLVGVSLLTETHAFYKELEDTLRKEAAARNLDLVIVACEMDPAKQAAQIEDFVAQHVDAILVAPCDSDAIAANLASPERAGIPVFTVDIAAKGGKVVSHIASDNTEGGRLAARTLASLLNDKGNVIVIDHPEVASVQTAPAASTRRCASTPASRSSDGRRRAASGRGPWPSWRTCCRPIGT